MHTAVRYGLTQALLHATALSHKKTMAEIIAARIRLDDLEDTDPHPRLRPQG